MFVINWGELDGRIDPSSFRSMSVFKSNSFIIKKLGKVIEINPTINFSKLNDEDEISFIPMENIDENLGVIKKILSKKKKENKGFTKFQEGDLLWAKITPCMQNGKSAIATNLMNGVGCGSTEFYVIRPRTNYVLIKYIYIILRDKRILKKAEDFFGGSAGQQRVSKDFLLQLPIPIPDMTTQQQIVDIMEEAYKDKQQKEREAKELLDSINSYLLGELSIAMPQEEDNTLESRKFYASSADVLGGRFDPFYNKPIFEKNLENIQNCKNGITTLKSIAKNGLIKGILPNDTQKHGNCKVVQITNINNDGSIDTTSNLSAKQIYSSKHELKTGDILIVITGATIGKIGFWDYSGEYYLGGDIVKFNTGDFLLNEIYSALLRTTPYQLQLKKCITGATNGHLSPTDIERLPLPIINNGAVVESMSAHLSAIRNKAKQLEQEADDAVKSAKAQVEKILLDGSL